VLLLLAVHGLTILVTAQRRPFITRGRFADKGVNPLAQLEEMGRATIASHVLYNFSFTTLLHRRATRFAAAPVRGVHGESGAHTRVIERNKPLFEGA
jgi:hypothetical protein